MHKNINVFSVGNYYLSATTTNGLTPLKATVKSVCGRHINRIDRLTQLALIGAVQCTQQIDLPENTGLFMSSIYGSLNNTLSVLSEMYQEGQAPRPLQFINTVSNAACYYLSKELNLQASNLFVSRQNFALEGCIKLALIDISLQKISAALIGLVCEAGSPIDIHYRRLNILKGEDAGEGSHWLLLARHLPGRQPIASIEDIGEPLARQPMLDWIHSRIRRYTTNKTLIFGKNVPQSARGEIAKSLGIEHISDYLSGKPVHEFSTALSICEFISAQRLTEKLLIHVDTDNRGNWSAVLVKK